MTVRAPAAAAVGLLLAGCGSGGVAVESSGCDLAMADAAEVGDMQDTVADLYPAVRACATVDEWRAAAEAHPAALDGADPAAFLANVCQSPEVADAALCVEAG